jgi:hypothetical protein
MVSEVVEEAVVEARTDEVVGYMLYTRRAMSVCLASNAFRMSSCRDSAASAELLR